MRILVDPSAYDCSNLGDVAMLQAAVVRLQRLWPEADIRVITAVPDLLAQHCPGTTPVSAAARNAWSGSHWPNRARRITAAAEPRLAAVERAVRHWRARDGGVDAFEQELRRADAIVLSGGGGTTDYFPWETHAALDLFDAATRREITTGILGQGFGPLRGRYLRRRAAAVLPRLDLITLRERRSSAPLLRELGVASDRVVTTGDDAIELVANRRGAGDANGLGVCVRVSDYSGVAEDQVRTLGRVLAAVSARLNAELVPIPISAHPDERDLDAIREVLGARGEDAADGAIDTPRAAIDRAARCRVVVTGSYHAGVFALAQGVPAIGLAASSYYVDKFLGLRDQFGDGCTPIMLDADDLAGALEAAIEEAWAQDPGVRAQLVAAGERQLEEGRAAYHRLFEIVESARARNPRERT